MVTSLHLLTQKKTGTNVLKQIKIFESTETVQIYNKNKTEVEGNIKGANKTIMRNRHLLNLMINQFGLFVVVAGLVV